MYIRTVGSAWIIQHIFVGLIVVGLFCLVPVGPAWTITPAERAATLKAEFTQLQKEYRYLQVEKENLGYREEKVTKRAGEIEKALRLIEKADTSGIKEPKKGKK